MIVEISINKIAWVVMVLLAMLLMYVVNPTTFLFAVGETIKVAPHILVFSFMAALFFVVIELFFNPDYFSNTDNRKKRGNRI